MDWQGMTTAAALFPSFTGSEDGCLPTLPASGPAWALLDPNDENGLKAQMNALSGTMEVDNHGFFVRGEGIIIEASATVEAGAYLIGPCYIGPRATVRSGAYVREYSWICADAVVGHATEVKHSVLLPGAKAPHFNYVGDSILGRTSILAQVPNSATFATTVGKSIFESAANGWRAVCESLAPYWAKGQRLDATASPTPASCWVATAWFGPTSR